MAITKTQGKFSKGIDDGADATAITINSSEQVGIGTASPAHKLQVNASAFDGVQFQSAGSDCGYIGVNANQLYVGAGAQLLLQTGNAGATDGSTRLRVDSDGIKFGSDSAAANALDDYEEGTWTATLIGDGGTNPTLTYGNQTGYYVKIGNIVTATWYSGALSISNAGSGYAYIQGLPYNSSAASGHYPVASFTHMTACNQEVSAGYLYGNNIRAMVHNSTSLATWTSGTKYLMVSVTYQSV